MSSSQREPTESELLSTLERQLLQGRYKDEYYALKRRNLIASVQRLPGLWQAFDLLDDTWRDALDDVRRASSMKQVLPSLLCVNAHLHYLVAAELGFSCCGSQARSTIRTGVESVAHAHKIHREPDLATVWLAKDEGRAERSAFNKAFIDSKETSLFPEQHGLGALHDFWRKYSDWGAHSTVTLLGLKLQVSEDGDDKTFDLHYFDRDGETLAMSLFDLFVCGWEMYKAFFDIFADRLRLDHKLGSKMGGCEEARERARSAIIKEYKSPEPAIWTP